MNHYPLRSTLQKTFHIIFQLLTHMEIEGLEEFAEAIEAKLREKNGG